MVMVGAWLIGVGLGTAGSVAAQADGDPNPFESEADPFAEDSEGAPAEGTTGESGEELPPPTVPDGYGSQPSQYPQPQGEPAQGYAQPGYPQPGYSQPGYQPRARRQRIPYQEGMEIPPGASLVEKRRIGLVITGAVMFAVSYGLAVSLYTDILDFSAWMLVPVLGPFVEVGNDAFGSGAKFIFALDGLLQAGGLALFIGGLVSKRQYVEYWASDEPGWRVAPRFGVGGGGLDLRATF
ncbi:MAG: hypothetical protein CMN30_02805 [Sandaracinus sp.]|nr:hypothetical protein [Sandaracinus sp.]